MKKENFNITYIHLCFYTPKCGKTYTYKSRGTGLIEHRSH